MKSLPEYLSFFKAIPDEKWFAGDFEDYNGERFCALGHLGWRKNASSTAEMIKENDYLSKKLGSNIPDINDRQSKTFPEATPKERICGAIRRAIEAEAGCVVS